MPRAGYRSKIQPRKSLHQLSQGPGVGSQHRHDGHRGGQRPTLTLFWAPSGVARLHGGGGVDGEVEVDAVGSGTVMLLEKGVAATPPTSLRAWTPPASAVGEHDHPDVVMLVIDA
jgi:hypothetical protein